MTAWLISVCGVALLSVLVDVVLPDGNTKKYVRVVIGVVISFSLLAPIANLFTDLSPVSLDLNNGIQVQQQFIDGIATQQDLARVQKVKEIVADFHLHNCSVSLERNGYVLIKVTCNKTILAELQSALATLDDKIMILWSENGG